MFADQLVFAFRFVDRQASARDHPRAVGRLESQVTKRRLEHEATQLRAFILEREVEVPGVPDAAIRQFAFDPDLADLLLEGVANADRQLGDREDSPWVGAGSRVDRLTAVAGQLATVVVFKRKIE